MQQRPVGRDKGEAIHQRSLHVYKEYLSIDERLAIYSVIGPDMELMGYVELFD
jgi:hypothetical protein